MNTFLINNKKFIINNQKIKDRLLIKSHPKDYEVIFDSFFSLFFSFKEDEIVLIDKNIRKIYDINHSKLIEIEAMEENKTIETVLNVCEKLSSFNFNKGNTLIVIGGGILQDIGAFTAKIYKRGIRWIYVPTTLLSQCDSCIGGKTALNFNKYKNQLALFSAPDKVIIDTNFLNTLSNEEIKSGYGEIIKFFLIGGDYYINNFEKFDIKTNIIHSLNIKKAIIEYDEFENDERKSLNYGHSFGHAIESITNYKICHGEAVMLGIEIINKLFLKSSRISKIINKFTNLDRIKDINLIDLIERIKTDKKVNGDIISLVSIKKFGETIFIKQKLDNSLLNKLNEIFTS
jgi:3-dehydroquinate synthase